MLIKLDDAERVVHATIFDLCMKDKNTCAGDYSAYALEALRALPVSDGWEDRARDALGEAEWCLKCGVDVPIADPDYHEEVKALGDKIGYGALMSTASKAWREALEAEGIQGGEFVTGPCRSTVENALAKIRAALGPLPAPPTIE